MFAGEGKFQNLWGRETKWVETSGLVGGGGEEGERKGGEESAGGKWLQTAFQ